MLGVVLWSDKKERKAVLWCDDHGDLAYFDGSGSDPDQSVSFGAGDMVQFDVTIEHRMRRAHDPRRVAQTTVVGQADTPRRVATGAAPTAPQESRRVIPFSAKDEGAQRRVCLP